MMPSLHHMTLVKWLAQILIITSAVIHFYLAYVFGLNGGFYTYAFVFAGFGFLAGSALILYNYKPVLTYSLGIPFTLGQIIWYVVVDGIQLDRILDLPTLHLVDKSAQVVLVLLLVYLLYEELK